RPCLRSLSRGVRRARSWPDRCRRWLCASAHRARVGPDPGRHHRRPRRRRAALAPAAGAHPRAGPQAPRFAGAAVPDALGVPAPHPRRLQPHATDAVHGGYTQVVAEAHSLDLPVAEDSLPAEDSFPAEDSPVADSAATRLAVVVPALNDDAALARLLPLLARLARA